MRISASERLFIPLVAPITSTPRSAKKVVNLYRLVRVGVPQDDLERFVGDEAGGPYQAVLILLAVLVGRPSCAPHFFRTVTSTHSARDIVDLVRSLSEDKDRPDETNWRAILTGLEHIENETRGTFVRATGAYSPWVPTVSRFSFHTREFLAEVQKRSDGEQPTISLAARAANAVVYGTETDTSSRRAEADESSREDRVTDTE